MEEILLVIGIALVALFAGVRSGARFEQNKYASSGFAYLTMAIFAVVVLAFGTHLYMRDATLLSIVPNQEKVYFVLKKVPDEKGAFLVLLDTENNNERVAHLAVYPPEGYSETALPDGRTVLAVTGRQIVVGDQNKADFVPAKK